jgi:hypothetical protein
MYNPYTKKEKDKIMKEICLKISDGQSLRQICRDKKMPHRVTILRWLNEDEEYAADTARARSLQADALDDDIQDVINEIRRGDIDYNAGKAVIWGLQWRAAKLRPEKYGEQKKVIDVNISKAEDWIKNELVVVQEQKKLIQCDANYEDEQEAQFNPVHEVTN